ncbi:MAG: hypothetical protein JWM37_675 [Candidatus Saccharibacteria bacterium]|nr:hypothetical protein [Candidatus Saccharibacteria bacterium]
MSVKLNRPALAYAKVLINNGRAVVDERDVWSKHQPSAAVGNDFIDKHGWREYSRWHLGIDDAENPNTKGRYKFPYGDFTQVHRCGVLAAESRAGQYKYTDIEQAAAHLHGMLEGLKAGH